MRGLLHKIRGLAGVGITWGGLWAAIGAGIGLAIQILSPESWYLTSPIQYWAVGMGLYGAVSGMGFATLLFLGEGRKTLFNLSLRRVAILGVIGSAAVPLLFNYMGMYAWGTPLVDILGAMGVTGLLGGIFAPGSIMIARKAALSAGEEHPLLEIKT